MGPKPENPEYIHIKAQHALNPDIPLWVFCDDYSWERLRQPKWNADHADLYAIQHEKPTWTPKSCSELKHSAD